MPAHKIFGGNYDSALLGSDATKHIRYIRYRDVGGSQLKKRIFRVSHRGWWDEGGTDIEQIICLIYKRDCGESRGPERHCVLPLTQLKMPH